MSGIKKGMLCLVILAFALLPVGRTVEIVAVLMAVFGLMLLVNPKTRAQAWSRPAKTFALLFALFWLPMVVSLIGAVNLSKTLSHDVEYLRFLFAGIFVLYSLREQRVRTIAITALIFVIGFWLIDSVIQRLFGTDLFGRVPFVNRITGPFRGLHMPIYLTLLLPLTFSHLKTHVSRYIFWPFFVLSLLVFFWTGSRASWIAFSLGMVLYGIYVLKNSNKKTYGLVVLFFISMLFVTAMTYHYDSTFKSRADKTLQLLDGNYESIDAASSHRLPIWQAGLRMFIDNPVNGIGAKGFRYVYHDYANEQDLFKNQLVTHPHLFVLEVIVETGSIGLIAMICALGFITRMGFRYLPTASLDQVGSFITLCIAFFPLNTHVSFYGGSYSQLVWLMTAVSLAFIYSAKSEKD
ncbi:MAG: O-antigen ligase family protein [Gammaproteobacteria bacterium]